MKLIMNIIPANLDCIDDNSFYNFYWNYCLFSLLQLVSD